MVMVGFVSTVKHAELTLSAEVTNASWFTSEEAFQVLPEGSIIMQLYQDFMNLAK